MYNIHTYNMTILSLVWKEMIHKLFALLSILPVVSQYYIWVDFDFIIS